MTASTTTGCGCTGARCRLAPGDPRHGTANGYGNLDCRCDDCREGHRSTIAALRVRKAYTTTCPHCHGPGGMYADDLCDACYSWRRRHGAPRPASVYAPSPRTCLTCGVVGRYERRWCRGRCEPCDQYLRRTGHERPSHLWQRSVAA